MSEKFVSKAVDGNGGGFDVLSVVQVGSGVQYVWGVYRWFGDI